MLRHIKAATLAILCVSFLMISRAEPPKTARQEMTRSSQLEIAPQEYSYLKYDPASGQLSMHNSKTPDALTESVSRAINLAPAWLKQPLEKRFRALFDDYVWTSYNAVLATADINRDGIADLVIGGDDGKLKVYLGPESGKFNWELDRRGLLSNISVEAESAPAFGDVNNDGVADLVVGSKNGTLTAYAGPEFRDVILPFLELKSANPVQPVFIDINGDNRKDLVIYSKDTLFTSLAPRFKNNGNLLNKITVTEGSRISACDINLDTKDEFITCDKDGRISVYTAGTSALTAGWWNINRYNQAMSLVMLEADSDNDLDLVCGRANGMVKYHPNKGGFAVLNQKQKLLFPTEVGMGATPLFADFNKDGKPELLITNSDGSLRILAGQDWQENKSLIKLPENSVIAVVDLNNDGHPDIVSGSKSGRLRYLTGPEYKPNDATFSQLQGLPGYSAPAFIDADKNGTLDMIVGGADNQLHFYKNIGSTQNPQFSDAPMILTAPRINDSKEPTKYVMQEGDNVRTIADKFYYDSEKSTLIVDANREKVIKGLKPGVEILIPPIRIIYEPINLSGGAVPRIADVNKDNIPDIIAGTKDGRVSVFLGADAYPENKSGLKIDWKLEPTLAESVYGGSYCAPAIADINDDNQVELVVTNANGELNYYEMTDNGANTRWEEKYSWNPKDDSDAAITKLYGYYYSETEFLKGPPDHKSPEAIAKVLQESSEEQRDEIAFAIAYLPTEVLRAMARLEQSDILKENARMVYDVASKVKYVRIKEKGDYTTLEYAEWKSIDSGNNKKSGTPEQEIIWREMPRDIYYWWVVHPRILYEIPCKVNGNWLDKTYSDYGMTQDEWWRHVEDWYVSSSQSRFWRMAMPYDRSQSTPLMERMQRARTLQEAVNQLHTWSSPQAPTPFITFGYLSDDLQPWIIYKRRYGSCGEQSIVTAALARSMLIPTASVFTRGEDHQWNEYFMDGDWHFWDVCGNAYQSVNRPWEREGYNHTGGEQSAIMRYWGSDNFDYTTASVCNPEGSKYTTCGRGYTDVGSLTIRVLDNGGVPIEGAFINIRRPGAKDMMSALGYTDLKGECHLELGRVSPGYTIIVASPYGSAGTNNYFIEENKSYTLEYRVAGKKPQPPLPELDRDAKWMPASAALEENRNLLTLTVENVTANINPPARFAQTRWTDTNKVLQRINYRGSVTAQYDLKNGAINLLVFDKDNFALYQDNKPCKALDIKPNPATNTYTLINRPLYFVFCNRHTTVATEIASLKYTYNTPLSAPRITVVPTAKNEIMTSDDLVISGTASDNAGIKTLELSFDSGKTFHDATPYLDGNTGNWSISLHKFAGGPIPAGKYSIILRASNYGGLNSATTAIPLTVNPARSFENQIIRQDNPDSPLPVCSWMLGPFVLNPATERFVDIKTSCQAEGADIDLFLFRDKNGDGKINGMEEKEAASTSPMADERISINDVVTGTYWIYAQGWKIESENTRFSAYLSFYPQPEIIGGGMPRDSVNQAQPLITARLSSLSDFDPAKLVFKMNGDKIESSWSLTRTSANYVQFSCPVSGTLKDGSRHTVELTATDYLGNTASTGWDFTVDTSLPQITYAKARNEKPGLIKLTAEAKDNTAVKSVSYRLDKLSGSLTPPNKEKDQTSYEAKIDTLSLADDEYELVITAVDNAGNKTEDKRSVNVRNPPARIFYVFPSEAEKVYTPKPLIVASYKSQGEIKPKGVRIWLDDKEITANALITADTLHYQLLQDLAIGKHTLRIELRDVQGNKAEHESAFEVQLDPKK
ncbi:MAG: FG-GAP-like repeat-containing protein [Candidatus Brocadiia bacterium]